MSKATRLKSIAFDAEPHAHVRYADQKDPCHSSKHKLSKALLRKSDKRQSRIFCNIYLRSSLAGLK